MTPEPEAFHSHDHASCSSGVLSHAEQLASRGELRLTPVRRRVLEILAEAHRALGAYDILDRLAKDGFGSQPPVAYRALDYLSDHGLVHRIRRLNAFAACMNTDGSHSPVFLICDRCNSVAELAGTDTAAALRREADLLGFAPDRMNIEVSGICPACRSPA